MNDILRKIHYQFENFLWLIKNEGFKSALKEALYFNRQMILVERDLEIPLPKLKRNFPLDLILVKGAETSEIEQYNFSNKVRRMKSRVYLKNRFNAFLGIHKKKIIAEQWWAYLDQNEKGIVHSDLKWMKINLKPQEIYAFDLFIDPEFRGSQATNFFIWNYLSELKKLNFLKVYGCFFEDNIPSLWVHRIFSYNEIRKVKRHRFFFLEIKNGQLCLS